MKLITVSGYLGSGKTTLVVKFAKKAIESGRKVAIIVNEIGEIGIDDQYMKKVGLDVWEILGGCICCTLSSGIVETFNQLRSTFQPDIVLLEPTGTGDLESIDQLLIENTKEYSIKLFRITVIDPLRLRMISEVLSPLITSQVKAADTIVISKVDEATEAETAFAEQSAEEINPKARVFTSEEASDPDDSLLAMVL